MPTKQEESESPSKPVEIEVQYGGESKEVTVHMKRQIGLIGCIAVVVGNMIGSGIFITPTGLLKRTDSVALSLIIWAACGLLSILTAISYVELGGLVPRSGGEHAYFMEAYAPMNKTWGQFPAFLFSWMIIVFLRPSTLGVIALSFGRYTIDSLVNALNIDEEWKNSSEFDMAVRLLAVVVLCFMAFVNLMSAKLANRLHIIFTCGKISAMVLIIGIGIYNVSRGQWGAIPTSYDQGDSSYGDIAIAFYSGLFTYDGWNNLNMLMEELENPNRDLPIGIFCGIGIVTTLYMLTNLAYLTVLDKTSLIESTSVAVDVGNETLGGAKFLIPVLVALATLGSTNASLFSTGRIGYVASRDGHLPAIVSYVHVFHLTPAISIILTLIWTIVLVLASSTIQQLIEFSSFTLWIFYALALMALLVLRRTKADVPRQIKVPTIIPVFALLVAVFLIVVPIAEQPRLEYLFVLGVAFVGLIFYWFFVHKKINFAYSSTKKFVAFDQNVLIRNCKVLLYAFTEALTTTIQRIAMVAPSPYKED